MRVCDLKVNLEVITPGIYKSNLQNIVLDPQPGLSEVWKKAQVGAEESGEEGEDYSPASLVSTLPAPNQGHGCVLLPQLPNPPPKGIFGFPNKKSVHSLGSLTPNFLGALGGQSLCLC